MSNDIKTWYDFVLQQMAAESYLQTIDWSGSAEAVLASEKELLKLGNNPKGYNPTSFTRMTSVQADDFLKNYRIVDHLANDLQSGFSATLMEKLDANGNGTGEYTLSFRSTEYRTTDGGDFVRDAQGADVDFTQYGFAFAQIRDIKQ